MGPYELDDLLQGKEHHHLDKEVGYRMEKGFLPAIYLIEDQYQKYTKNSKKKTRYKKTVNQVQQLGDAYPKQKFSIEKTLCF